MRRLFSLACTACETGLPSPERLRGRTGHSSIAHSARQRASLSAEIFVDTDVILSHPPGGEAPIELSAHGPPVQLVQIADCGDGGGFVRHDNPVRPWSITSGTEPRLNAITGVPQAIASNHNQAEWLRQVDREHQGVGTRKKVRLLLVIDLADIFDMRLAARDEGADLVVPIRLVAASIFAAIFEFNPGFGRYPDGLVHALSGEMRPRNAK